MTKANNLRIAIAITFLATFSISSSFAAPRYTLIEVPSPTTGVAATGSFPGGINNTGQISGTLRLSNGSQEAFRFTSGVGTEHLGFLPTALLSVGYGINSAGQVTGWSFNQYGQLQAFIHTPGVGMQALPFASGGTGTEGRDINNMGAVVGKANSVVPYDWNAFKYVQGSGSNFVNIGGGTFSEATAINDSGTVAGFATGINGNPYRQAFVTSASGNVTPLGYLPGGSWSLAHDINEAGQVAGYSTSTFGGQAFLYTPGSGMLGLGMLAGSTYAEALGINASGKVVGVSYTPGLDRAFLYSDEVMQSLNDLLLPEYSSYKISYAADINDKGQIAAYANGRAVLLTPVPEPATILQLLLGLAAIIFLSPKQFTTYFRV